MQGTDNALMHISLLDCFFTQRYYEPMKPTMSVVLLFLDLLILATINFSFCNTSTYVNCTENEREALLKFKQDLKDPCNRLASWSGDKDCCTWAGVFCDNLTGHVLELHLQNNFSMCGLGGKINPSLLDLKELIYLNLRSNDFYGIQIPRFLGSMGKLKYLDLYAARFSGMIPPQLGNLSDLRYLDLGYIYASEYGLYVDNLSWLSGLSLMVHLGLSGVNLTGASESWLLVINDLPVLQVLKLSYCGLHHLPHLPIANFSSLTVLDFSWNQLGSSIPSWIFNLTDLVYLSLSANNFQGPIPDGLQNLTSLMHFDLSSNSFNSSMPDWLYKFSRLKYLSLARQESKLDGRILTSWGRLCNLRFIDLMDVKLNQNITEVLDIFSSCISNGLELLDLSRNQFSGHLTDQLGKFKNLVYLDLRNNSVSGVIPVSLGALSSLESLYLSYNKFEGTISEIHFANLTRLSDFDTSENSLTLTVSPDWIPPFQLASLALSSCHIGPRFPTWLHSQKNLYHLDISNSRISDHISSRSWEFLSRITAVILSHNQIHGEIPSLSEFDNLDGLDLNSNNLLGALPPSYLDLSNNNLSGPLPPISSTLGYLDLSNNNLSGSMTQFLCYGNKSKNMRILNLKDNFLSGELSNCWINWQNLEFLNLGNNKLTGNLPISMANLTSLRVLHLHKNNFFGAISALDGTNLEVLDIGENEFVGKIPTWVGERFSRLVILNLRSNKFRGALTMELCRLSSLQILDLADNNFSGTIPTCVNNFSAMATMEYSVTNSIRYAAGYASYLIEEEILVMKGALAEYGTILNLVRIIDLSKNNFFGEIPIGVTSLKALQSLNLSHNFLTGRIPNTIGAMTLIESIDLSANHLSSEIPSSISNLTFLSHLNFSNNNLVGRIPSSTQLQSFTASSFTGNELCGLPLPNNCTTNVLAPNHEKGGKDGNEREVDWFFISLALGFVVGFWSVIGPLLVNRRWRYMYCRFLDYLGEKFCCFVRICW